jgi:hypothetical protein
MWAFVRVDENHGNIQPKDGPCTKDFPLADSDPDDPRPLTGEKSD